jgi:hypothetical protein
LAADTINAQEFQVTCGRQINSTSGTITAVFNWNVGPPDLPFSPLEALQFVNVFIDSVNLREDGTFEIRSVSGRFIVNQAEVGERRLTISISNETVGTAVITLNQDASGTLTIRDIDPSLTGEQDGENALQFEVSQLQFLFFFVLNHLSLQISYLRKDEFFYRNTPTPMDCFVDTTPILSDPVEPDSIMVDEIRLVGGRLSLNLSWELPEETNGEIQEIEIRLTTTPLLATVETATPNQLVLQRVQQVSLVGAVLCSLHPLKLSCPHRLYLKS